LEKPSIFRQGLLQPFVKGDFNPQKQKAQLFRAGLFEAVKA